MFSVPNENVMNPTSITCRVKRALKGLGNVNKTSKGVGRETFGASDENLDW